MTQEDKKIIAGENTGKLATRKINSRVDDQSSSKAVKSRAASGTRTSSAASKIVVVRQAASSTPKPQHTIFTGRRKSSVARVWLVPRVEGVYAISINGRTLEDYMPREADQRTILKSMIVSNKLGQFDVMCTVKGGGSSGQSGAIQLGIARALLGATPDLKPVLKKHALLTRDSRMVERKKPGQHGARKKTQFSKR